jgi:putative DNA primase/helicase
MTTDDESTASSYARFQQHEQAGAEKSKSAGFGDAKPKGKQPKPEIELGRKDSARLGEAVAGAMMHLALNGAKIYQRGGRLVRPVVEPAFDAESKPIKVTSLIELEEGALKLGLMKDLRWFRKTKDEGKRFVNPGYEIPRLILRARGDWPFPAVSGLINAPTLRPEGSLLCKEGYDEATGLLLLNAPSVPINLNPTRADAEAALATLKALLVEVPFADNASRAVVLSLIFSTILRGAFETTPLHILVSPSAGTGKSFIVDIASLIATGGRCAVVAATQDDEELDKRIGAAMLAGRTLISLDNHNGELRSSLLSQAVTQPVVYYRPLGASTEISVTNRSVFAATGINLSIADDLGRRTLMAQLDAHMERPWEKKFTQDPLKMIARDRPQYIWAALTIPLAYVAAGKPVLPLDEVNGFGQWSRLVRAPLMWLGEADPATTMQAAREGDAKLQAKAAVLAAMADLFGLGMGQRQTVTQIIEAATEGVTLQHKALHEALMAVAGAGKEISTEKLGYWLRAAKGQIVGGLRLCGEKDRTNTMRWWAEKAKG